MKASNYTPALSQGTTQGALQVSMRGPTSDNVNVQRHNNNYRSKNPAYVQMNNAVVSLDAQFSALPLTGPAGSATQQAWDDAAMDYAGVPVCGCKGIDMSGKKLFRLANWHAATKNLPPDTTPPNGGPGPINYINTISCLAPGGAPRYVYILLGVSQPAEINVLFNLGHGLQNLWLNFGLSETEKYLYSGDDGYDELSQPATSTVVSYCVFDAQFRPGGTRTVARDYYP